MGARKRAGKARVPGEGERAARRGYVHQDRASARLIYEALANRTLRWVGLADRSAGVADDLVMGVGEVVVAHQFKRSLQPSAIGLAALLLGQGRAIEKLVASYAALRRQFPCLEVRLRYLTNDYPSPNDRLLDDDSRSSTAAFLAECATCPRRTLAEWRATRWAPLIEALVTTSGLSDEAFGLFWRDFDLVAGPDAAPVLYPIEDKERSAQIEDLARALSVLVADNPAKDRWSRAELLEEVGWPDRFALRFAHSFPVGAYVQRNEITEARLAAAMLAHTQGYLSLVGPPGAGKSTLLQRELRDMPGVHVVRYLAFVPGTAQGHGRGEADSFYDDLNSQLAATGLEALRVKDDTTWARQQEFEHLLTRAGERHASEGVRYVIVVDGLDHIPREEHPDRTLLAALPLPQSVPDGVVFVLGTQRLDLEDMPAAVRGEAGASDRQIDIAPLSERAVASMADALGLPQKISRGAVYQVTCGHPLVTRYLVERLIAADPEEREQLLLGEHGFSGDLEAVYEAAWRGVEQAENSTAVKQVLALLAHAQGPIEPSLLSRATSDEAVERALKEAGHLLEVSALGWSVFHNSFRLFVRRKPILRFGVQDQSFIPSALYRALADLTYHASSSSPQRWLTFRYLYLAGALDEALALGHRSYFVSQYCDGRSAHAVRAEISDAFRALKSRESAVKLFDLMLADDEVDRRATVMEGATSLIDAYLSVGDLEAASASLHDSYEDGKQWLVVDALLEAGQIDQARQIFERQNPLWADSQNAPPYSGANTRPALPWAERAILFLDEAQLDRYLLESTDDEKTSPADQSQDSEDLLRGVKFQLARAVARADTGADLERVSERWSVDPNLFPLLLIEAAWAAFNAGGHDRARQMLEQASAHHALGELHASWASTAARLAIRIGAPNLATEFIAHAPLQGLRAVEDGSRSERLVPVCRALVTGVVVRVAIGTQLPSLKAPKDRLLKGVQHHLVVLATAIGEIRARKPLAAASIGQIISAAIRFLAIARTNPDEDWFTSHLMPRAAEVIGETVFSLLDLAGGDAADPAGLVDTLIADNNALFRWWPGFRRLIALRTFDLNGDADAAVARLEAGLADVSASDPREEVEEKTAYAAAIGKIGATQRARSILAELRDLALGVYLPAKKDGQYELWADTLAHANAADPARRAARAETALRLVDGLEQTEGSDAARRIGRQLLFEASAADPTTAWSAARWAARTGTYSWDGIVDATLRGILVREPALADAVLIAWSRLCLPWYGEPHGSTTRTGQFLRDLMANLDQADIPRLEEAAAAAIGRLGPPDMKVVLLSALEEAAKARGGGEHAHAAKTRWEDQAAQADDDPEHRSYGHLIDLAGVAEAVASELAYRDERDADRGHREVRAPRLTYGLRRAAARVIASSTWDEAQSFADAQPSLCTEPEVAMALARVAAKAGKIDAARAIVAPLLYTAGEGWSWPSDRGRLRYHEIRHLLGEPDAYEAARAEFVDDMARSRYGVGTTLWATAAVFPLLFKTVPWPELWERLEAQLQTTRDYRMGKAVPKLTAVADDAGLIAELFSWALSLGVPLIHAEAARGAAELLSQGHDNIFVRIVDRLLEAGDEGAMLGMELLTSAVDHPSLLAHFRDRLGALADNPDLGVAAAASFLAERWGAAVVLEPRELPFFYQLHLPPQDVVRGQTASDAQTRGMVIEDPLGWTEGWESLIRRIARDAEFPAIQIRWRVRQFIQSWGGIESFGHAGSKRLEGELNRIGLKLAYRRPQAEATLRALRYVVGELWRAGRLSYRDWRYLLLKLHVDPDKPILPDPQARPVCVNLPAVTRMLWGRDQEAWLEDVSSDLKTERTEAESNVLAEWRRSIVRETRVTATAEQWRAAAHPGTLAGTLEELLESLPNVIRIASTVPLYDADTIHPSRSAIFEPHALQGEPSELLILCPHTAELLGWTSDPRSIHLCRDAQGEEMARTTWWRDGLPQPVDEDERCAVGQRILLSKAGLRAFEAMFGPLTLTTLAWRRIEAAKDDGVTGSRFATDNSAMAQGTLISAN